MTERHSHCPICGLPLPEEERQANLALEAELQTCMTIACRRCADLGHLACDDCGERLTAANSEGQPHEVPPLAPLRCKTCAANPEEDTP